MGFETKESPDTNKVNNPFGIGFFVPETKKTDKYVKKRDEKAIQKSGK